MRLFDVMRLQVVLLALAWISTLEATSYCLIMTIYRLLIEVYYVCLGSNWQGRIFVMIG